MQTQAESEDCKLGPTMRQYQRIVGQINRMMLAFVEALIVFLVSRLVCS